MINIPLIGDYSLTADENQWIIRKDRGIDKDGRQRHENISYHTRASHAIHSFFHLKVRLAEATTVDDLVLIADRLRGELLPKLAQVESMETKGALYEDE